MTENHNCPYRDDIIEMKADIKWLVSDTKRRNGIIEEHIRDSEGFRRQVDRNTVWRHAYKVAFLVLGSGLWWAVLQHMK